MYRLQCQSPCHRLACRILIRQPAYHRRRLRTAYHYRTTLPICCSDCFLGGHPQSQTPECSRCQQASLHHYRCLLPKTLRLDLLLPPTIIDFRRRQCRCLRLHQSCHHPLHRSGSRHHHRQRASLAALHQSACHRHPVHGMLLKTAPHRETA